MNIKSAQHTHSAFPLICAFTMFVVAELRATTNVVTSLADSGPGSLREAITNATSGDTILFSSSIFLQNYQATFPILLTNGPIVLDKSLTIIGSPELGYPYWGGIELRGLGSNRIVEVAMGTTNVLTDFTIRNGNSVGDAGGGVWNQGTLTMNNCSVVSNTATYGGGGIASPGILTMNNCTLAHNLGGVGGGVFSFASWLTMINCTVVSNSAGSGSGIYVYEGTLALTNCIVSANSNENIFLSFGSEMLSLSNLVDFPDPQLAPLGYYNGRGFSMPPLYGSPVINAGSASVTNFLSTDSRGFLRRSGEHVDIGATEFQVGSVLSPPWISVQSSGDSDEYSLRAAATYSAPGSLIRVQPWNVGPIILTN